MDRRDRPTLGTFFVEETIDAGRTIALSEKANQHARARRIEAGETVRVVDGAGVAGIGVVRTFTKGVIEVEVGEVTRSPRPPAIHARVPVGDKERMLWLAEKATELGIESWQAVMFHRSRSVMPRGEGEAFAAKARARMISALEQSGGVWLPRILPDATPDSIDEPADASRIVLDVDGEPLLAQRPSGAVVIALGPEGGLESAERAQLIEKGWRTAQLAATTLRFETAGVAAIAVVRAAQLAAEIQET